MTVKKLVKILDELGVPRNYYLLDGNPQNIGERYTLSKENENEWLTFYSERGEKTDCRKFKSENEACVNLLVMLLEDHSIVDILDRLDSVKNE